MSLAYGALALVSLCMVGVCVIVDENAEKEVANQVKQAKKGRLHRPVYLRLHLRFLPGGYYG